MDFENLRMPELKALVRERELVSYSQMRKAELIELLRNNQLSTRPAGSHTQRPPIPAPRQTPALRPPRTRPPRPNRPPPTPPSVRFRPDRPRQPELLRKPEERNLQSPPLGPTLKPYQLKPKRGKETFIEPPVEQADSPPTNPKKLKRM